MTGEVIDQSTRTHGGVVATTVAYDLPARYRIAPATRVSGSLMPRPSWSGTERSEMVSRAQRVTVVADSQRIGDVATQPSPAPGTGRFAVRPVAGRTH